MNKLLEYSMLKQKLENTENLIKERFAQYLSIHCGNSTEDILRYLDFHIYISDEDTTTIEINIDNRSQEYYINYVECRKLADNINDWCWTFHIPNVLDNEIFEIWIKENKVEKL